MPEFKIQPEKTALIVHDLQRTFVSGPFAPENSQQYVEKIRNLIQICRSKGIRVIYTKVAFRRDGADMGLIGEFFEPIKKREILIDDQKGTEIIDELAPLPDDVIIRKVDSYSAFHNTALESILRNLKIDTIILVGGATNVGVEAAARDAHSRGIKPIVLEDATFSIGLSDPRWGTMSADVVQKNILANIAFCIGQVLTAAEVIKRLN
jgi:ureidoacrylate peracid hydrolase